MKKVRIGMIGSGFAARLHAKAYQRVCGVEAELYACSSLSPDLEAFAREFGFRHTLRDYREMLENPEILQELVKRTGAKSTDLEAPESCEHLCSKCTEYAKAWGPVAERLWEAGHTPAADKLRNE